MSRLLARINRERNDRENAAAVERALREAIDDRGGAIVSARGGDARAMRGVPISAVGVSGTLPGTDPEQEACRER